MENIIEIKRKKFTIIDSIQENKQLVQRKGNNYLLITFNNSDELFEFVDKNSLLRNNGIKTPKIYLYDKKTLQLIIEYIDGDNVFDLLCKQDLNEDILKQVFLINWFAKNAKIGLDFSPDKFVYSNKGILYYIDIDSVASFDSNKTLEKKGIFLWFYGKDFVNLLISKNIPIDSKRYSPDKQAELNKQIALSVVKFYQ